MHAVQCSFVALALTALPALGQNYATNPTFDANVAGWEATAASITLGHIDGDGFVDPGAAEVEGTAFSNVGVRQCISLTGITLDGPLVAHAAVKPVNYEGQPVILVSWLEDDACESFSSLRDDSLFGVTVMGDWSFLQGGVAEAPEGAGSVRITAGSLVGDDDPTALTRFDDIHLGPDPFPFFEDGFETGDTSGWTSTTP